ncbi:glycosyltransferase family 4 protein [Flavobacterium jejuense]|uniref:Glycosyltransferase family 4 protein n=1 Tax=Flavobacterium jejuense TaxID=1544455 RepID=A0ABX0IPL3_9FLAO|nr:glycosyltransferase family 4 protein [Flavobacterium jejuense]NHN24403.1 glycosyltransferase family 4 protein [Flavobacterium jejuense]
MIVFKFFKQLFIKKEDIHIDDLVNINSYDTNKKTIIFITGVIPTFDKDSGSNRLKEIILAYKKLNYNCVICYEVKDYSNKYYSFFKDQGIMLFQFKEYHIVPFLKSINTIDLIWLYGPYTFKKNIFKLNKHFRKIKKIYDMIDIHHLRLQRAIDLNPIKYSFRKRFKKFYKIETKLAKKANIVVAISDEENKYISEYLNPNRVKTISNVHYPKINKDRIYSFEDRKDILFIGSTHTPNIDAIYYLYNDIMPLVWNKNSNIKVNVIGNLNEEINNISHPNFIFHGYVENIEDIFISNKMMVAPLRYGAGVKGKLGQAFEYYLPIVSSSIGVEGMGLLHNKNVLIADKAEDFANEILNLYENKDLWEKLQNNSEESLKPFSREKLLENLKKI